MVTNDVLVFDRDRIAHNRRRASKNFSNHDFLYQWSRDQLSDRLNDINRTFGRALHIGSRCSVDQHAKIDQSYVLDMTFPHSDRASTPYICGNEEFLPVKPRSLDLIISNLNLHSVNDLPGTLVQIQMALKNDGLFLVSLFGGETLFELRSALTQAETDIYGGASPRVFPFADKPQTGELLQRANFALPVIDSDIITVTYDNIFKLLHDIRGMGESNSILARNKRFESKALFMRAAEIYHDQFSEDDGRIVASFEIIFLLGWAPDESQQKPLRPGSAKQSLADALSATEMKTGDKAKP